MILLDFLPGRISVRNKGTLSVSEKPGSDAAFFLSGRKMKTVVLMVSMAATNFSAFTILGLSGAGYRIGYAFYPVMAFGTGFMALGMYLVGAPLGKFGRERNYISPVDFITDRYGSPAFSKLYAVLLVVLTLPYLALQPMAAGILLETTFGIPYRAGVVLCSVVVGLYTARGGMRAVARTDLVQGVIIVLIAAAAYAAVVIRLGGVDEVGSLTALNAPEVLSRFGRNGAVGPAVLAGYIVLWFFADPMFPQLNQRMLAAESSRALEKTVTLYPVITMILFFLTVSIGVIGAGTLPGLSGSETDRIWPLLVSKTAGNILLPVFMIAPLAAIMSTLDSQLLSLTSIVSRDLLGRKDAGGMKNTALTAVIACAGLIIALFPPRNILDFINKSSFLGYAALAPVVFGGLYTRRVNAAGAAVSIIVSEILVLLSGLGIVDFGPVPDVFIVCAVSWAVFFAVSAVTKRQSALKEEPLPVEQLSGRLPKRWAAVFGLMFILGVDFITYYFVPALKGGGEAGGEFIPGWLIYQAALCAVLTALFYLFFDSAKKNR